MFADKKKWKISLEKKLLILSVLTRFYPFFQHSFSWKLFFADGKCEKVFIGIKFMEEQNWNGEDKGDNGDTG